MIEVYLARHGQTEENISRIFQGHLPGRLTEEGKRQAVELGEKLKDIELDAIVSSDLQRVADRLGKLDGTSDSVCRSGETAGRCRDEGNVV